MKILLVDDSKSARYALRLQLQRHGVDVETADCAESAFEFLKTQLPDAILMDHMMPGLNGFEALDVIRADPRTAAIPVVMCTSHEEPEFVTTANQKGVFGILPKSAAADFLPEILDRLQVQLATAALSEPEPSASVAPIIAPPPVAVVAPAAPAWSEETVLALVEERLNVRLAALLTPQLDALRRELLAQFASEIKSLQQRVETQLAETAAIPAPTAAPPALTVAEVQTLVEAHSSRVTADTSELLKRGLYAERALILEQVAKQWRELPPAPTPASSAAVIDETALLRQATAQAQRAAKEQIEAALAAQPAPEAAAATVPGMVYGLFVLATVLGMGAAAAVYFVLTGAGMPPP